MSYGNIIMSSEWDILPFLSYPDEIANFDFSHYVVALQCDSVQYTTHARPHVGRQLFIPSVTSDSTCNAIMAIDINMEVVAIVNI